MPRSFNWKSILGDLGAGDTRSRIRIAIGGLLLANLIAGWATIKPVGGSAEELDAQVASLRQQILQRQVTLKRTRAIYAKMEQARNAGDKFMTEYFMARKTASSTILSELGTAAKESGMK